MNYLLLGKTRTSFKIGGLVGIIILLLGITVLFGVYQMSKVSQEIIEISEEFVPMYEIIADIRHHNLNQAVSFEKLLRFYENEEISSIEQAKEEFWSSGGSIDSDISRGKNVAQAGLNFVASEKTKEEFEVINQKISSVGKIHNEYESLARELFLVLDEDIQKDNQLLLEQINEKEIQLQNELDATLDSIAIFTDESTNQIEANERDALLGQILIVTVVGAIAATLGIFISRINKDLKKEVDTKTVELRDANEKLKELDKMKDEFIGIASHELKSPIQPIFGFAELAKAGDIDQKEAWDGVTELATRLQDLANAVLDVSRIESNRLVLHVEKIRINDIILDTAEALKMNLKKGVVIQENLDEDIEMEADRVRIAQVLRNILNNALKFTPKGTISIDTHVNRDENKIHVLISDTGLGIPEDILPNVFGKFVTRGHKQENQGGTGLGLFLCKGIINAHGGKISARNNPDGGATFEFILPILHKKQTQQPPKLFKIK